MIKKIILSLFVLTAFSPITANAEIKMREFGGIIYVNETTVAELEELFGAHKYLRFKTLENDEFPAIFVRKFPSDYNQIPSKKYRNELFIRILTPLALKVNEEIANERQTLLRITRHWEKNHKLTSHEIEKLEKFALKYDFFTRQKGEARIEAQLKQLKLRIDIVPPSILVAAAAMNTNWGDSRLAQKANSLYKEKVWYSDEGLEPLESKNDGFRYKIFNSLIESMRSFALKFNSNINYQNIWAARNGLLERHGVIIGESIAYTLSTSSNLPNYAGILDYTTAYYDLLSLDVGKLKKGIR